MSLALLADTLRRLTGLDVGSLGTGALAAAVLARRPGLGEAGLAAYVEEVARDARARSELVSELLVHETSFFRYPASLAAAAAHVLARHAAGARPVRVLSAPCSTGQEPASVVMALLEAGVPPRDVVVDAVDLSPAVVARARAGVYAALELRGLSEERRARHGAAGPGGFRLRPEVLEPVRFAVGDLLEPGFGAGAPPYDVVLCRNLLIYLTPDARLRLLHMLRRLLAPDGLLLLGHAEVLVARVAGFAPVGPAEAYGVRPAPAPLVAPPAPAGREAAPAARPAPRPAVPPVAGGGRPTPRRPDAPPAPRTPAAPAPASALAEAQRRLHAGDAEAAHALLRAEERAGRAGVEHFYLLALLARALERPEEAEQAVARALYLDPGHAPTLRLAALVAREAGDAARAALYEARAERAAPPRPAEGASGPRRGSA